MMGATDWMELSRRMVESQLRARGIEHERVLDAMRQVPRHLFVPKKSRHEAYEDKPLPIGAEQTISQPYMVALMTQLLDPRKEDTALEVGTGSGYQAAVLSLLVREVYSIERVPELASRAQARLGDLGYENVRVICGDGTMGCPSIASFDRIIITAGGPCIPNALEEQLAPDGRLLCPVGSRETQQLCIVTRTKSGYTRDTDARCMFVPLIGREAWPE